jgi:hypothetical protein
MKLPFTLFRPPIPKQELCHKIAIQSKSGLKSRIQVKLTIQLVTTSGHREQCLLCPTCSRSALSLEG